MKLAAAGGNRQLLLQGFGYSEASQKAFRDRTGGSHATPKVRRLLADAPRLVANGFRPCSLISDSGRDSFRVCAKQKVHHRSGATALPAWVVVDTSPLARAAVWPSQERRRLGFASLLRSHHSLRAQTLSAHQGPPQQPPRHLYYTPRLVATRQSRPNPSADTPVPSPLPLSALRRPDFRAARLSTPWPRRPPSPRRRVRPVSLSRSAARRGGFAVSTRSCCAG